MKKPLNYRLQMYRALAKTMCTICWFRWIFLWFCPFLLHTYGLFMQKVHIFAASKIVNVVIRCKSMRANNKSNFLVDLFIRHPSTLIL